MSCRIVVSDSPHPVKVELTGVVDDDDLMTAETAARIAFDDGHRVILAVQARPVTNRVVWCITRVAAASAPGMLTLETPDPMIASELHRRGLDDRVWLGPTVPEP